MKQKLIYDTIHGNIELSGFEVEVLNSPQIHRLHQILQNSMAYNVYPNLKTTRFEHSIGTMKYAGDVFQNGLLNSEITGDFIKEKGRILSKLISNNLEEITKRALVYFPSETSTIPKYKFKNGLASILGVEKMDADFDIENAVLLEELKEVIGHQFQVRNIAIPNSLVTVKDQIVLLILYQVTRYSGLVHDLGHLPFSHLFESAIENVYAFLDDKADRNNLETQVYNWIKPLVKKGEKIHEVIGNHISHVIFKNIKEQFHSATDVNKKALRIFIYSIFETVYEEFRKKDQGAFSSLYAIIDGTIDVDRLDFVQRDGYASGISKSTGNVDRIIRMFCVGRVPLLISSDGWQFMPAVQSLNDVEEVLYDRYRIYKYVVNHHAVRRTDFIFHRMIELQIIEELKSNIDGDDGLDANRIFNSIQIIHDITNHWEEDEREGHSVKLIQITDYWLLTIFNNLYNKCRGGKFSGPPELSDLLLNIYQDRRSYKSLWKRDHEYHEFVIEFVLTLARTILSLQEDEDGKTRKLLDRFASCIQLSQRYWFELEELSKDEEQIKQALDPQTQGEILQRIQMRNRRIEDGRNEIISDGIKTIGTIMKLKIFVKLGPVLQMHLRNVNDSVIIATPKLNPGIGNCFLIDIGNQKESARSISAYSGITHRLNDSVNSSWQFFVYFNRRQGGQDVDLFNACIDFFVDKSLNN